MNHNFKLNPVYHKRSFWRSTITYLRNILSLCIVCFFCYICYCVYNTFTLHSNTNKIKTKRLIAQEYAPIVAKKYLKQFEVDKFHKPLLYVSNKDHKGLEYVGYYSHACYQKHKTILNKGDRITDAEAEECLDEDIAIRLQQLHAEFNNFNSEQIAALILLHYNIGNSYKQVIDKKNNKYTRTKLHILLTKYNELLSKKHTEAEKVKLAVQIASHWREFIGVNGVVSEGIIRRRDVEIKLFFNL